MRILVKIGGAQLEQDGPRAELAGSLAAARAAGHELVVVHGGGNQIRRLGARLGIADRYVDGLRVTDAEIAPLVLMVLAGEVNRHLVAALERAGVPAVGLTGAEGGTCGARRLRPGGVDIGYVGSVAAVRTHLIDHLLAGGFTPVIASVAPLEVESEEEQAESPAHFFNVNADQAAAPLARAFGVDALLFLTDVEAVLDERRQVCRILGPAEFLRLRKAEALAGGMLPKVEAALEAARALPTAVVKIAPAAGRDAVLHALSAEVGTLLRGPQASLDASRP
jgi:acetylglutamate kinase